MPDTPVAEVEAVPVQAQVVSGDERTRSWYYRQAEGVVPDCQEARDQQYILRIMGDLKMYQQHLQDTNMIAEGIFNTSLPFATQRRLLMQASNGLNAYMSNEFGICEHNEPEPEGYQICILESTSSPK
eukprot:9327-Heterococcus_DN1.PRE.4